MPLAGGGLVGLVAVGLFDLLPPPQAARTSAPASPAARTAPCVDRMPVIRCSIDRESSTSVAVTPRRAAVRPLHHNRIRSAPARLTGPYVHPIQLIPRAERACKRAAVPS